VVSYVTRPQCSFEVCKRSSSPCFDLLSSYLLSKGANPNTPDNKGITPIDLAAKAPNSIRSLLGLPPVETSTLLISLCLLILSRNYR
jgi:hypothetical protein